MNDSQYFQKSFLPCGSSKDKSQGFATALWILQNTLVLTTFTKKTAQQIPGLGHLGKIIRGSFPTRRLKWFSLRKEGPWVVRWKRREQVGLGLIWSRPRGRLGWCLREAKGSVRVQSSPMSSLSMFLCSDSPHSEPGTIDEVDHDNGTEPHTSDEGEWGEIWDHGTHPGPHMLAQDCSTLGWPHNPFSFVSQHIIPRMDGDSERPRRLVHSMYHIPTWLPHPSLCPC